MRCSAQPTCWSRAAWCDMSEWGRADPVRCDKVASYCDMRTGVCRGTRVAHPNPNPCVDWASMRSRPVCFMSVAAKGLFALLTVCAVALAGAERGVPPRLQAEGKVREALGWSSWCLFSAWVLVASYLVS